MFDGAFREGKEDFAHLEELEGVVSARSFELLIQWMFTGRIIVGKVDPVVEIETVVEFAWLADFCQVEGVEDLAAQHIKTVILANPTPPEPAFTLHRHPDTNTCCIISRTILWASFLPDGHAVRKILAMAVVESYLRSSKKHKFAKEAREVPNFANDVLDVVKVALSTLTGGYHGVVEFKDTITGMVLKARE
jgi:hypothetical protein